MTEGWVLWLEGTVARVLRGLHHCWMKWTLLLTALSRTHICTSAHGSCEAAVVNALHIATAAPLSNNALDPVPQQDMEQRSTQPFQQQQKDGPATVLTINDCHVRSDFLRMPFS